MENLFLVVQIAVIVIFSFWLFYYNHIYGVWVDYKIGKRIPSWLIYKKILVIQLNKSTHTAETAKVLYRLTNIRQLILLLLNLEYIEVFKSNELMKLNHQLKLYKVASKKEKKAILNHLCVNLDDYEKMLLQTYIDLTKADATIPVN